MKQEMYLDSDVLSTALSPEILIDLIEFKPPTAIVRVRGKITRVTPFPKENPRWYYGTLESLYGEGSLSFKCDAGFSRLAVFQHAVFEGILSLKPLKFSSQAGLEVLLTGNCLGSFEVPKQEHYKLRLDSRITPKTSLKGYIEKNGLENAILLGTKIAVTDVASTMEYPLENFKAVEIVSFGDTSKVFQVIEEYAPTAIIFTRGGDDETMGLWDNPDFVEKIVNLDIPFYTALGHAHRITLADHYADQSFLTPSDLGHSIREIATDLQKSKAMREILKKTTDEKSKLELSLNNHQVDHKHTTAAYTGTIASKDSQLLAQSSEIKALKNKNRLGILLLGALFLSLLYIGYRWQVSEKNAAHLRDMYQERIQQMEIKQKEALEGRYKKSGR